MTTNNTHTPGPIRANGRYLVNRHGNNFAEVYPATTDGTDALATADRIVACWYACEGVPTETLVGNALLSALRAQRDELAAALRQIRDAALNTWTTQVAVAALAKVQ